MREKRRAALFVNGSVSRALTPLTGSHPGVQTVLRHFTLWQEGRPQHVIQIQIYSNYLGYSEWARRSHNAAGLLVFLIVCLKIEPASFWAFPLGRVIIFNLSPFDPVCGAATHTHTHWHTRLSIPCLYSWISLVMCIRKRFWQSFLFLLRTF